MLQAGGSRVRDSMRWMNFLNVPNPSSSTRPWSLLCLEHKWVPEAVMFLVNSARPVCKADNLTAVCQPTVLTMWDPQQFSTLYVPTACYGDSFTFWSPVWSLSLPPRVRYCSSTQRCRSMRTHALCYKVRTWADGYCIASARDWALCNWQPA
jgi:hypothetical protein